MDALTLMEQNADLQSAVSKMIKTSCIVDFGVVLEVVSKGVVKVGVSVAKNAQDIRVITCTLISPVSQSFSVDIEPQKDDKVLVFYPRTFDPAMFGIKQNEVIMNDSASGYNRACGLAILFNQYRENDYKTKIQFNKDSEITIDNTKATITVDKNGNVAIDAKNGKVSIKNSISSLYDIIDGMLTILNSSLATQGSPASHVVVPQQFAVQKQLLDQVLE